MATWNELERLFGGENPVLPIPPALSEGAERAKRAVTDESLLNLLARRDPGFDPQGVPNWHLREMLARGDTEEERAANLDRVVGAGNWTRDAYGRYAISPEAAARFGVQSDKPVIIDEGGLSRYDVADIWPDVPAMGASMVGAEMGAAAGAPLGPVSAAAGGILGAGLGAALGRGLQESGEAIAGQNLQSAGEVGSDLTGEAYRGMAGEGVYQGLAPIGRWAMAPQARRMTQGARDLVTETRAIGARPAASAVTDAPLLSRAQSMWDNVIGDPRVARNAKALDDEMDRLLKGTGTKSGSLGTEPGELIKNSITRARGALSRWSRSFYNKLDESVGGAAIIPTDRLRAAADDIIGDFPRSTKTGQPIGLSPELQRFLKEMDELPRTLTLRQAQGLRSHFWDAIEDNTLVPGINSRYAAKLYRELSAGFDDVILLKGQRDALNARFKLKDGTFSDVLKRVNSRYKDEIRKFADATIRRIAREPDKAGSLDPEQVVSYLFRPRTSRSLTRVMSMLPKTTKGKVRRAAMEELMDKFLVRADDPKVGFEFNGKSLLNALDKYGKDTLHAMFGPRRTEELYRLGRVAQFASYKKPLSGGIVAANVALHPLRNITRLAKINIFSRMLETPTGFKWVTEGLTAPNTRAGVAAITRLQTRLSAMAEEHTQEFRRGGVEPAAPAAPRPVPPPPDPDKGERSLRQLRGGGVPLPF